MGAHRLRVTSSLRGNFGLKLLNSVETVKNSVFPEFDWVHLILWDGCEPLGTRGGGFWFEVKDTISQRLMWWTIQKWLAAESLNLTEIIHRWVHNLMAFLAVTALRDGPSQKKLVIEGVSQKVKSCPALFLTLHHGLTDFATEHAHHHGAWRRWLPLNPLGYMTPNKPLLFLSLYFSGIWHTNERLAKDTLDKYNLYESHNFFFKPLHLSFSLGEKKAF